jgi:phosphotransferase system HPr (HPr) family protein
VSLVTVIEDRTWMRGALHARPANLLARLSASYAAKVELVSGDRTASTRNMLDLLALGADEGDCVLLRSEGPDAELALRAIRELIERNFDQALVPEVGRAVVPGIAIGRASLVNVPVAPRSFASSRAHERHRAYVALARARVDLGELLRELEPAEQALLAPEEALIDAIEPRIFAEVLAGASAEDATLSATFVITSDLVLDARARILDGLSDDAPLDAFVEGDGVARVLIVRSLTPTLVARVSRRIVGVVALMQDQPRALTSHAVLLARGRGLPLAFVPLSVIDGIEEGSWVLVDTTGETARVWVDPAEAAVEAARARKAEEEMAHAVRTERAKEALAHLRLALRTNLSSLSDEVPTGADGVGLVRTELIFAGRSRVPTLAEQTHALMRIAARARGRPITIRLFDGGADKPVAWLPQPGAAAPLRGFALLACSPHVLRAQIDAIGTLAGRADLRVLIPMTEDPADVEHVRSLAARGLEVGAMIESTAAALAVSRIAEVADFISIGTNDLEASLELTSAARLDVAPAAPQRELFHAVERIVAAAHGLGKTVTVCGELASEKGAAHALVGLGVDALSLAPSRFLDVKLSLLAATREECARAAAIATGRAS